MTNQPKPNSIINSLKRLERAGLEHSRTNEKLREAAQEVAEKIIEAVQPEPNIITPVAHGYWADNGTLYSIDNVPLNPKNVNQKPSLFALHQFARDVANGLLDAIAETLEQTAQANEERKKALEEAAK